MLEDGTGVIHLIGNRLFQEVFTYWLVSEMMDVTTMIKWLVLNLLWLLIYGFKKRWKLEQSVTIINWILFDWFWF